MNLNWRHPMGRFSICFLLCTQCDVTKVKLWNCSSKAPKGRAILAQGARRCEKTVQECHPERSRRITKFLFFSQIPRCFPSSALTDSNVHTS
jgi:hypothetical protein